MLRLAALGGGLAATGGALALPHAPEASALQGPTLAGAWQITISDPPMPPAAPWSLTAMMLATSDGLLLISQPPVDPDEPGGDNVEYSGESFGVWQATGALTAAFTVVCVVYDADARFNGTEKLVGTLELSADGNSLSGTMRFLETDARGREQDSSSGDVLQGTRVRLEAL